MTSESQVPEWQRLQRELAELAWNLKLENVYVMDAWLNRWCSARPSTQRARANVDAAVKVALDSCRPPLQRGGKLDEAVEVGDDWVFVLSFAGIYLLVLQLRPPEGNVTAAVRMRQVRERGALALPAIEALTLALPPPQRAGVGLGGRIRLGLTNARHEAKRVTLIELAAVLGAVGGIVLGARVGYVAAGLVGALAAG